MMVALVILAVWHPGRFLIGPDSEFHKLSRKEKKEIKREKKETERDEKEDRKRAKRHRKRGSSSLMHEEGLP
jgi:UTP:GlnB (protein PII) uridylyltransferase